MNCHTKGKNIGWAPMQMTTGIDFWTHVPMCTTGGLACIVFVKLGHPEIGQLEITVAVQEEILGFNISMDDTSIMYGCNSHCILMEQVFGSENERKVRQG